LVATLNFTEKCFTNTCDFAVVTRDAGVVSSLRSLFQYDSVSPEDPLPGGLCHRLIIGPDCARTRITALLEQARRSISIIDHKLVDPQILSLLNAKKLAGVSVDVLSGREVGGLRSHGRMILVDDAVAVIGSIALAPLNLDFRREVAIEVRQGRSIRQLRDFFEACARGAMLSAAGRTRGFLSGGN
jgi:phosphatidylserine/phosphatidylglycerophosphate/cardiolipin synthase-like enzyme